MRCWVAIGLLGACVSGEIQSGEDPHPPRIPINQVDPKPGLIVITDPTAQLPMAFRVLQFEEPNLEDTLTVRWFVDYYRNPAIQRQSVLPPQPQSPRPTSRSGAEFILTWSMLEPSPTSDPHLVEALVSDRPFDDPGRVPDLNRTLSEGAQADLVSWTVAVKAMAATKPRRPTRAETLGVGPWGATGTALGWQPRLPPLPFERAVPGVDLLGSRWRAGKGGFGGW